MKKTHLNLEERERLIRSYLGKTVSIEIDRPIGHLHRKGAYELLYPINYGFLPGVLGGDGEELDVYLLGVDVPVKTYTAEVVGAVWRSDDVEDKLIAAPVGMRFTKAQLEEAVRFQEQYHISEVEAFEVAAPSD